MYFSRRRAVVILFIVPLSIGAFWCYARSDAYRHSDANKLRAARHVYDLARRVKENPVDPAPMQELRDILNGDWWFPRMKACCALGELGPLGRPATPDLIRALDADEPVVMREAARALGDVSRGMPDAVPALIAKLPLSHSDVCVFSAEALGKIGEPALVAIPALESAGKPDPQAQTQLLSDAALRSLVKLRKIEAAQKPATE
jgi:hypothetical protein